MFFDLPEKNALNISSSVIGKTFISVKNFRNVNL